ncbi:hypothetical protein ACFY3V_29650 [Streptosporangium sp. NPDC000095]|uniref:hypothetical protein n=1 Tax=Streptosporangium sp. NPDC000095 TaxID=3366184 RepID=UPI003690AE6E
MSRLIERLPDTVTVWSSNFMIMDLDGANGQPKGAEDLWELSDRANPTDWFLTAANVAIITSQADSWHVVDVALELWDRRPPADDDQWTRSETAEFYSSSGKLQVVGVHGHSSGSVMDLRDQARRWFVRASVRPGPGARYFKEHPPEGLEVYRLQFWPTQPSPSVP